LFLYKQDSQEGEIYMTNKQLELIVGENLVGMLIKDDAAALVKSIKKLRKESKNIIPLVHITDEIKIDNNSYQIRNSNELILRQKEVQNINTSALIDEIIKNIDEVCNRV